jgi:TPR repeat protein
VSASNKNVSEKIARSVSNLSQKNLANEQGSPILSRFKAHLSSLTSSTSSQSDAISGNQSNLSSNNKGIISPSSSKKDYTELNLAELTEKARANHIEAIRELGNRYHFGIGVKQDELVSHDYFWQGAELGDSYCRGQSYYFGLYSRRGGFPDASSDNKKASLVQAVAYFKQASFSGYAPAQAALAGCYFNGEGVEINELLTTKMNQEINKRLGIEWLQGAAMRRYPVAQFNLGLCHANGNGVEKSLSLAKQYFQQAAEQGLSSAQFKLGQCYEKGLGVTANPEEAVKWYQQAKEYGNELAADQAYKLQNNTPTSSSSKNRI